MKKIIIITSLIFFHFFSSGQVTSKAFNCRSRWKYLITDTAIQGQLLYFLPVADCGYLISASLSIIKTITGDTIRVLQLCDTTKRMIQNCKVKLLPNKKMTTKASIIPLDERGDCMIIRTFYGRLFQE